MLPHLEESALAALCQVPTLTLSVVGVSRRRVCETRSRYPTRMSRAVRQGTAVLAAPSGDEDEDERKAMTSAISTKFHGYVDRLTASAKSRERVARTTTVTTHTM